MLVIAKHHVINMIPAIVGTDVLDGVSQFAIYVDKFIHATLQLLRW